jgi:hypothetical protein
MELTPRDIASEDCGYWAVLHKIRLQASTFSFVDHEYQIEPMSFSGRRMCYLKAAQSFGATAIEILKDLHGMIHGHFPLGVLHTFPTNDEVGEFSKSRFKPLIAANHEAIGKYVKTQKGSTDTNALKMVKKAFLFLRGARLSEKVGDTSESTSSKTAGFSVDKCVFDEVDYMDVNVIEKFKQRMGESALHLKKEVYLGNPSHEDFGIHLIFQQSDQRYWFRKCNCSGLISTTAATTSRGNWTCAEKSFPQCVKIRSDGTGYIGCDKCGKEIPMWAGEGSAEWVPDYPDKTKYMQGYMGSQLMSPRNDPAEILEDFVNPPFGNLADVYRLRLGRPYSNRDEKLRKSDVLANCGNDSPAPNHKGPCAMGVDVGKIKHVVIGIKIARERYEIIRACKVKSFQDVYDLAKKYHVKSDVVDIRPYEDEARNYQKSSGHKTFLCEYSDTQIVDSVFNENTGIVKTHRTGIFDQTHRLLSQRSIVLPCQCPEIDEFARQCCNCAKFEEQDKRKGTIVYRYRPTGDRQEHFRNALNYFILAASGHRLRTVSRYKKTTQEKVISNYARI